MIITLYFGIGLFSWVLISYQKEWQDTLNQRVAELSTLGFVVEYFIAFFVYMLFWPIFMLIAYFSKG